MGALNRRAGLLAALCLAVAVAVEAQAPKPAQESAGALLYSTHCVGCHTAQVHWRAGRRATSWATLQAEVRRWQGRVGLGWSEDDIAAVARHLNALHYRFPAPNPVAGTSRGPA